MSTAQAHDASHLQHKVPPMKTATLPPLRVDPALREAVESVLQEGESPSAFVEASVRDAVARRQLQEAFIARGLASRDAAARSGRYLDADTVLEGLGTRLEAARRRRADAPKG